MNTSIAIVVTAIIAYLYKTDRLNDAAAKTHRLILHNYKIIGINIGTVAILAGIIFIPHLYSSLGLMYLLYTMFQPSKKRGYSRSL